jgi:hypothetical protein
MGPTATTAERGAAMYECAMCREPVTMTEKNGLGYCETHWRAVHPQRLRRLARSIRHASEPTPRHGGPQRRGREVRRAG